MDKNEKRVQEADEMTKIIGALKGMGAEEIEIAEGMQASAVKDGLVYRDAFDGYRISFLIRKTSRD
jgi:hypothetical protein